MNTINNLISSSIGNQLPSFIATEYPLFVDFIQTYYQGLERSGESLDLVNNLLNYLDVDFYQNNIKTNCILSTNIGDSVVDITVDSTAGFPDTDGLIQIDSEIILYKTKTDTQFLSCSRGVSGVTNIDGGFEYSYSTATSHTSNSTVTNLSYLFILYFFSKIKSEYLPYFNQNFAQGLNVSTFIKNIKQFYNVKGTAKSFDFLIRSLFNVNNETLYPKENLIRPSDAVFSKTTFITCSAISGNPSELVGQKLYQETKNSDPANPSIDAFIYIDSVQEKFTESQSIYELVVDDSVPPSNIEIPPETRLINPIVSTDTSILVDSTIGFPDSGFIKIESEFIKYTDKTINQFLNCTRGYNGTTAKSYELSSKVKSTFKFYGFSNVDNSVIELEILGVSNSTNITDFGRNYYVNDIITSNGLGFTDDTQLTKSWIFNVPKLLKISSIQVDGQSVTVTTEYDHRLNVGDILDVYGINSPIFNGEKTVSFVLNSKQFRYTLPSTTTSVPSGDGYISIRYKFGNNKIPADVINIYDENNEYVYVASSGVPSHSIGSGISLGNQRFLKKIPRTPINTGVGTTILPGNIGIFVNGVPAKSCISKDSIIFGEVTSIEIDNPGFNYGVGVSGGPSITISNGSGITATASCLVDGRLKEIYVINGGSGYKTKPVVQIIRNGGSGIDAQAEAIVSNGRITDILITNSGTGYTSLPTIALFGGGGTGASFVPEVAGPISEINLTNAGTGYTSIPNVTLNLGNGAIAFPIISNGSIQSVIVGNGGFGYYSAPEVFINDSKGTGFGAKILANVSNGSITSFTVLSGGANYNEGFTTVSIVPRGGGAVLTPKVRTWTFNLFKSSQVDLNNGISSIGKNSIFGNEYSYIASPSKLRLQKSDNINQNLTEKFGDLRHSPILGWAYDGNPIYGPYAYADPLDASSGIIRMTSSYVQNSVRTNGPSFTLYPKGTFIEDYVYQVNPNGLDEYNGRFCITPEYPDGIYAYFVTMDASGLPEFPYILGKQYRSVPDAWNFSEISIQKNLPNGVLRYRDPYENLDVDYTRRIVNSGIFNFLQEDGESFIYQEDGISYIESEASINLYDYFPRIQSNPQLSVRTVETGSNSQIDGFYIENSGINYKPGDKLVFDNENTGGYGASAKVDYVFGSAVTSSASLTFTKIKYSNLNGVFNFPTNIIGLSSGTGATIYYVDKQNSCLYTKSVGTFLNNEIISTNYNSVVGTGTSTLTTSNLSSSYSIFTLQSSIGSIDSTITLNTGTGITVGSNLLIQDEIVKVFSGTGNTFNVYRKQFGTSNLNYGSGTTVYLIPTVNVNNSSLFEIGNYAKIDNEVFRIVDLNNSINNITVLRSQLGSGITTHSIGSTFTKVVNSFAQIDNISTTKLATLGTATTSNLNQFDVINVTSTSENDSSYIGDFSVLFSNSSAIVYEVGNVGTGISGNLSYITNSKTALGPISEIKLNSGGEFYEKLPEISVSSSTGNGAIIIPTSKNFGKIKEVKFDNFGYGINQDYTLRPELEFNSILRLKNTLTIKEIKVLNGGSGYQYTPIVTIAGGGGEGASAIAKINNGKVYSIEVTNGGYGYSSEPTISVKKSYPFFINAFNSTLNFTIVASNSFQTGDPVTVYTDGDYPLIYGGIPVSPELTLYAIVGGSLDSNQLRLATTASNAQNGIYVPFATVGSGNLSIVSESGNAILSPVLDNENFLAGEYVYQYDNDQNIIASGIVSSNFGWDKFTKTLRLFNVSGKFLTNSFRIVGSKSNSSGFIYSIESAKGWINPDSFAKTYGNFITETGNVSNGGQFILDSDYYQEYSYVLKNDIDYINWNGSVKNVVHPAGFKLYGNRTIFDDSISTGRTTISFLNLKQSVFSNLSLLNYNDYALSQPDYTTTLKDQVTIFNRTLTSFEQILTSQVDKIDDFSSEFNGVNRNFPIYFNNGEIKPYNANQILISLNGIIQNTESYSISNNSVIKFSETVPKNSVLNVLRIGTGASFAQQLVGTGASVYTISSGSSSTTSLVTVDGVIQSPSSYTISGTSITFSENISSNSSIYIRSYGLGMTSRETIDLTSSTNIVPITSTISSPNYAIISLNGVVQNPSTYSIGSGSTCIIFDTPIDSGVNVHIMNFDQNVDYYNSILTDGNFDEYVLDDKSATDDDYIVTIDGIVQYPGLNKSFTIVAERIKSINFKEAPKANTKFFGLLYNRINPSGNAIIDDLSKNYLRYDTINGTLVENDYLQIEGNSSKLCNVISIDTTNKLITITGTGTSFGTGQTVISGLASSVSTGITTIVALGSGITFGNTSFSVGSTSGFSINDYIVIGGEVMRINSISSGTTSFTVSRGLVATPISYHSVNSLIRKIIPASFTISSGYTGFNSIKSSFTLSTGGNPYNVNGTPFSLPSEQLDSYGQDYSQSLLTILNETIQNNGSPGSFTLAGSQINFSEPPKEGTDFYARYFGKLRRLNNISSKFNGTKLSFNLNIGNNIIYSISSANQLVDVSNNFLIFMNGILQNPGESFVVSGSRIIFAEPPKPGTDFFGYVYIGSDDDTINKNVLSPIEVGDNILISGEQFDRNIISIDSSNSVSTLGYTGTVEGTGADIVANVSSGKVVSFNIKNGGIGYDRAPVILFKGGGGIGAKAYAVVNNGTIVDIILEDGGINYTSSPQLILSKNLTLKKTQRVRKDYESTYKKVTTLGSGITFGTSTSLPAINQTIGIGSTFGFKSFGSITIIDDSRPYPVIETVTYSGYSGNNLTGCVRGVGYRFNKVMKLDNNTYNFSLGQTITNGTGATGNVISWDSSNLLLFVNKTSITDFSNGDTIVGVGAGISDAAFIKTYLSFGAGTTIIQIS